MDRDLSEKTDLAEGSRRLSGRLDLRAADGETAFARKIVSCIRAMLAAVALLAAAGCAVGPKILPVDERTTIDRSIVEYPTDFALKPYVLNLDSPTAIPSRRDAF